jgi:hypothetical protein
MDKNQKVLVDYLILGSNPHFFFFSFSPPKFLEKVGKRVEKRNGGGGRAG